MSNEMITQEEQNVSTYSPNMPAMNLAAFDNVNQGTIAIEASRAIAEAQGKLVIAKRFPRNEVQAYAKAMQSCQRKGLAEKAFYSYSRGGSTVSGPTIRFAEELARCWGNIEYGIKELSQDTGKSEMHAFAWDLETNSMSSQNFTNPHMREAGGKSKALTSQRDIYEINANMAARRLRARILAVLPGDLVESAIQECKKTLAGKNDEPLIDRVKKMVVSFERYGVSQEQIERRLKRGISTMSVEDLIDFVGIFNSLKDGASKPSDWFESMPEATEISQAILDGIEAEGDKK